MSVASIASLIKSILPHKTGHTILLGHWVSWTYVSDDEPGEYIGGIKVKIDDASQKIWTSEKSWPEMVSYVAEEVQRQQSGGQRYHTTEGQCSCSVSKRVETLGTEGWNRR
jgi:hypothetical protein